MKKYTLTPVLAAFMLMAVTLPAYALDVNVMGNLDINKAEDGRMYKGGSDDEKKKDDDIRASGSINANTDTRGSKDDNKKNDDGFYGRIKSWIISAGTTGQVTAVSGNTLTVKGSNGTVYTVTTTDATIRRGKDVSTTPIAVGEQVYIMGVMNGTSIVASTIIAGKTANDVRPTADDKRQSYLGVITAKNGATLTVLGSNNTSYTVVATNAEIWVNKTKSSSDSLKIGERILVQGTLSGTTITANKVLTVRLPEGIVAGKITAINGTTLTVLGSDNKTYTVTTTSADIKVKGNKDAQVSNLAVGNTVVVKGNLTDSTIAANTVVEGKVKGNIFNRFGIFFKSMFGKNK